MIKKYGNWALITGASSGIGEEFAKRLAGEKLNLVLIARREERLKNLSIELIVKYGIEIKIVAGDITESNTIEKIKEECAGLEIGILVNNAGFGSTGEFIKCDAEKEIRMTLLNCVAPVILTHHFLPLMAERRRGAVIFLGSLVAFQPTPLMAAYSATKAFNLTLGEALWYEVKKYNIDVLALNPGGTDTEFQRIAAMGIGPTPRTPQQVVETALNALGRKPGAVDGIMNKSIAVLGRFLPRKWLITLAGITAGKLYSASSKKV